jgi:hypothetical protein
MYSESVNIVELSEDKVLVMYEFSIGGREVHPNLRSVVRDGDGTVFVDASLSFGSWDQMWWPVDNPHLQPNWPSHIEGSSGMLVAGYSGKENEFMTEAGEGSGKKTENWKSICNVMGRLLCTDAFSFDHDSSFVVKTGNQDAGNSWVQSVFGHHTSVENSSSASTVYGHFVSDSEGVCVDSLQVVVSLLPCRGKRGLSRHAITLHEALVEGRLPFLQMIVGLVPSAFDKNSPSVRVAIQAAVGSTRSNLYIH